MFGLLLNVYHRFGRGPIAIFGLVVATLFGDSSYSVPVDSTYVSPVYLGQAVQYAKDLYQNCPPEKCFILNYGVSTAVASAYFRQVIPDPELRRQYYAELMVEKIKFITAEFDESVKDLALFDILDQIIPPPEVLNGRPVVIHRTLFYGGTISVFAKLLARYKHERRPDLTFGYYLIGARLFAPALDVLVPSPAFFSKNLDFRDLYARNYFLGGSVLQAFADTLSVELASVLRKTAVVGVPNPEPLELTPNQISEPEPKPRKTWCEILLSRFRSGRRSP